ncbi:glycoside hydrolase family 12 protein [Dothistroma septosporum NZE10]|uniref:Glycoside hydrolase family 12 protein n=1 Tax=Dothistroma septosporum (strain NZE10 / CBS 128990) TaxID=675120 RepID=M2WJB0_DOTSN|nr:glycoside hydrolase family 12 protein [Dothistroma septosporum NZE10]
MPSATALTMIAQIAAALALPHHTTLSVRADRAAQNFCGAPNDYAVISGSPWIVYSMNYAYQEIDGSACTGYESLTTASDGTQRIKWNSTWAIAEDSNADVVKGYEFVGLTENLENTITSIDSIPASYQWVKTNTTAYKGNVCFDFMTSDTKGDSTSSSAQELMLWLRYEGGQVPIGYSSGSVATVQLYNKSWKLYQGKNEDTGITVSSLLVDEADQYYGSFEGDIKDWLLAMVDQGLFTTSTYVNVGNAGMEPFYGTVDFKNTLGLQINLA